MLKNDAHVYPKNKLSVSDKICARASKNGCARLCENKNNLMRTRNVLTNIKYLNMVTNKSKIMNYNKSVSYLSNCALYKSSNRDLTTSTTTRFFRLKSAIIETGGHPRLDYIFWPGKYFVYLPLIYFYFLLNCYFLLKYLQSNIYACLLLRDFL